MQCFQGDGLLRKAGNGKSFLFPGSTKRWNCCGLHLQGLAAAASSLGTFARANLELIFYKPLKQWEQSSRALLCWYCTIPESLPSSHPQIPSQRGHKEINLVGRGLSSSQWDSSLLLPLWSLLMVPGKHRGQEIQENSPLQPGLCSSWCGSEELRCCTWGWFCSIDFSIEQHLPVRMNFFWALAGGN